MAIDSNTVDSTATLQPNRSQQSPPEISSSTHPPLNGISADEHSSSAPPVNLPLVELRNVSKRFKRFYAQRSLQQWFIDLWKRKAENDDENYFWPLKGVSFTVHRGERIGIIGHNGTGKSTLLKLITGILEPTSGEIAINGRVSSLLELGAGFHPDLSGRENIVLNATLHGLSRRVIDKRLETIVHFAGLEEFIDTPVKHYSSGMYMRLGFSVAIHTDPDLLIVDEVLAVGDANFQKKCMTAIHDFCQRGGTLILVTHDLHSVETICNRAIWMEHGLVCREGQPLDVTMAYLSATLRKADPEQGEREAAANDRRSGNGKVQIDEVILCDSEGNPRQFFDHGDAMQIRMHYRRCGNVDPPNIGIGIHHENGTHITGPNIALDEVKLPDVAAGWVTYHVPTIPLLPGGYHVTVAAVHRITDEVYDMHDRLYEFRIDDSSTRERFGLVSLQGRWQLEGDID